MQAFPVWWSHTVLGNVIWKWSTGREWWLGKTKTGAKKEWKGKKNACWWIENREFSPSGCTQWWWFVIFTMRYYVLECLLHEVLFQERQEERLLSCCSSSGSSDYLLHPTYLSLCVTFFFSAPSLSVCVFSSIAFRRDDDFLFRFFSLLPKCFPPVLVQRRECVCVCSR